MGAQIASEPLQCCSCQNNIVKQDKLSSTPTDGSIRSIESSTRMNKRRGTITKYAGDEPTGQRMGRRRSTKSDESDTTRLVSRRKSEKPQQNLLAMAVMLDFQESLKDCFRCSESAFERLGGSDDARIDRQELHAFLSSMGYTNAKLNAELFELIDDNHDGFICKGEFTRFFRGHNGEIAEFKELLRALFRSRDKAFDELGGKDDGQIDLPEFQEFVDKNLGIDAQRATELFRHIDDNKDGCISKVEFKALFQPQGETARVVAFKDAVKEKFKSFGQAFDKLGGRDDGFIDKQEFQDYMSTKMGFAEASLNEQLFNLIDDNSDGYISKCEFRALFLHHTARIADFQQNLKKRYSSPNEAFNRLRQESSDSKVSRQDFHNTVCKDLGFEDAEENDQLFNAIDRDHNGRISKKELKDFYA